MSLEKIGERDLITSFRDRFTNLSEETVLGIGDDAAVIRVGDRYLVITTDAFTEWVHFRVDYTSPDQLGGKALTATVSDCAAMGCAPRWVTVAIATPEGTPPHRIHQIYEGLQKGAKRYGCDVVGGDTIRAMSDLSLVLTAVGEPYGEKVLTRSGAEDGDDLYVTGRLGGPMAALNILERSPELTLRKEFRASMHRYVEPEARIDVARVLGTKLPVSSLIDLSDGLSVDLHHLARESGVGFRLEREQIPILPSAIDIAEEMEVSPDHFALNSGEEFELLFTASPGLEDRVEAEIRAETGVVVTRIGSVVSASEGVLIVDPDGVEETLEEGGYQHFQTDL